MLTIKKNLINFRYFLSLLLYCVFPCSAEITASKLNIEAFYYDYHNPEHVRIDTPQAIWAEGDFQPVSTTGTKSLGVIWFKITWDASGIDGKSYLINDSNEQKEEIYTLFREGKVVGDARLGHASPSSTLHYKPTVDITGADAVLIRSCCNPNVPLFFRVVSEKSLLADYYLGIAWHGAVYAIVIVMLLYNLFIFSYLREKQYLYYAFYLVSLLLFQALFSGLGKHFIWQDFEHTDILRLLFAILIVISNLLFQFSFLASTFINPLKIRIKQIIIILCFVSLVSFALYPVFSVLGKVAYYSMRYTFLFSWVFILYVSISSLRAGDRSAKVLLITQGVMLFAGIVSMMRASGSIANYFIAEHIIDIAIVFEAIVLSLALAQKIRRLREENLNAKAEQLATQQHFSHKLLTVQETEKKQLGSVLHDSFTHKLLLLKNDIDTRLGQQSTQSQLVLEVLDDIRNLSHTFHPHVLTDLGLQPALQDMVERVNRHGGLEISLAIADVTLDETQQLLLYRIVQESLNNVFKHAEANECLISLRHVDDRQLLLLIVDDGKGFDVQAQTLGLGLKTLKERADMLSAELTITSSDDGTRIHIQFPLR